MKLIVLLFFLIVASNAAVAQCRLALVLAIDVSASVNSLEDKFQRAGLANALHDPDVQDAILSVPEHPVALSIFEWSGRNQQNVIVDWSVMRSPVDLENAANQVANSTRLFEEFPTSMGYAVAFASKLFSRAPTCDARTLDISGDGKNNHGFGPQSAYKAFPIDDVTVNGLTIGATDEVTRYYRTEVIKGFGAFIEPAENFEDFERAMIKKLIRETTLQSLAVAQ